jgi:hypothetical protein
VGEVVDQQLYDLTARIGARDHEAAFALGIQKEPGRFTPPTRDQLLICAAVRRERERERRGGGEAIEWNGRSLRDRSRRRASDTGRHYLLRQGAELLGHRPPLRRRVAVQELRQGMELVPSYKFVNVDHRDSRLRTP